MVAVYSSAKEIIHTSTPIDMDLVIRGLESNTLVTTTVLRYLHEQRMGRVQ